MFANLSKFNPVQDWANVQRQFYYLSRFSSEPDKLLLNTEAFQTVVFDTKYPNDYRRELLKSMVYQLLNSDLEGIFKIYIYRLRSPSSKKMCPLLFKN